MDGMFRILWWSGPGGVAIFFIGLGVLLWGVSKVKAVSNGRDESQ